MPLNEAQIAAGIPLQALLERAREWDRTATPDQKAAMHEAQRQSFMRAFAPCEHGDRDWETCPQCLAAHRTGANKP